MAVGSQARGKAKIEVRALREGDETLVRIGGRESELSAYYWMCFLLIDTNSGSSFSWMFLCVVSFCFRSFAQHVIIAYVVANCFQWYISAGKNLYILQWEYDVHELHKPSATLASRSILKELWPLNYESNQRL